MKESIRKLIVKNLEIWIASESNETFQKLYKKFLKELTKGGQ